MDDSNGLKPANPCATPPASSNSSGWQGALPDLNANPETFKKAGLNTTSCAQHSMTLFQEAQKNEGPKGAAYGAAGAGMAAVGTLVFFTAPVSIPLVAAVALVGGIWGWRKKD